MLCTIRCPEKGRGLAKQAASQQAQHETELQIDIELPHERHVRLSHKGGPVCE